MEQGSCVQIKLKLYSQSNCDCGDFIFFFIQRQSIFPKIDSGILKPTNNVEKRARNGSRVRWYCLALPFEAGSGMSATRRWCAPSAMPVERWATVCLGQLNISVLCSSQLHRWTPLNVIISYSLTNFLKESLTHSLLHARFPDTLTTINAISFKNRVVV